MRAIDQVVPALTIARAEHRRHERARGHRVLVSGFLEDDADRVLAPVGQVDAVVAERDGLPARVVRRGRDRAEAAGLDRDRVHPVRERVLVGVELDVVARDLGDLGRDGRLVHVERHHVLVRRVLELRREEGLGRVVRVEHELARVAALDVEELVPQYVAAHLAQDLFVEVERKTLDRVLRVLLGAGRTHAELHRDHVLHAAVPELRPRAAERRRALGVTVEDERESVRGVVAVAAYLGAGNAQFEKRLEAVHHRERPEQPRGARLPDALDERGEAQHVVQHLRLADGQHQRRRARAGSDGGLCVQAVPLRFTRARVLEETNARGQFACCCGGRVPAVSCELQHCLQRLLAARGEAEHALAEHEVVGNRRQPRLAFPRSRDMDKGGDTTRTKTAACAPTRRELILPLRGRAHCRACNGGSDQRHWPRERALPRQICAREAKIVAHAELQAEGGDIDIDGKEGQLPAGAAVGVRGVCRRPLQHPHRRVCARLLCREVELEGNAQAGGTARLGQRREAGRGGRGRRHYEVLRAGVDHNFIPWADIPEEGKVGLRVVTTVPNRDCVKEPGV
mmetsp:Transcript_43281/g.106862  ORF Transcript_43281/g.106862 Transcript_43281/m.106862 type:complete len:568 (+) Transcript_43281:393-2096(+)